jgi:hypothetical protein
MHRMIMGNSKDESKQYVDHINRDRLDNRKINLRWVSHLENMQNLGKRTKSVSGLKNVTWDKSRNKWIAWVRYDDRRYYIGRFLNKWEASRAVEQKRVELGI